MCGPGAYVVLKALAFRGRGEPKDAYDLFYVLRNYGEGPQSIANALHPIIEDEAARLEAKYIDICDGTYAGCSSDDGEERSTYSEDIPE